MPRLVGYIRVSRVAGRTGDSFISPAVQRDQIERLAQLRGHEIVAWIEDLDQPGTRPDRPGFQQALAMVEAGEADGVAAAKLDRLARSVIDGREALHRLQQAGGTLVLVAESLDTTTPMGKAMFTILLAFAELEVDRIRENWDVARTRAIERGVHISRVPPVGYQRADDRRLAPAPVAAPVIRELFDRRAAGESWAQLGAFLDDRLPRQQGAWTRQTVASIIGNRVYLGEARQGRLFNPAAHEPLVGRAVWEQAQMTWRGSPRRGGALLAGLVRCAGCGYTMSRISDGRRGYANYRCRVRHAGGVCPTPTGISVQRADMHVEEQFLAWLDREPQIVVADRQSDPAVVAVGRIEAAEEELAAYRDANLLTVIGRDAYLAGLDVRQRAVDDARRLLVEARREVSVPLLGRRDLRELWPQLDLQERRAVLGAAVDAVFVRRAHLPGKGSPAAARVWIVWAGEGDMELPGRRLVGLRPFVFPEG